MDEKRSQIIEGTAGLFFRYGIRSITMDDIAQNLGISKKTLYLYFNDKNDLVKAIVNHHISVTNTRIHNFLTNQNAIDTLLKVSEMLISNFKKVNPALNFDLKKYYPEAFQILRKYKQEHILSRIEQNIEQGKEEGLYRKDVDSKIIAFFICRGCSKYLILIHTMELRIVFLRSEFFANYLFIIFAV